MNCCINGAIELFKNPNTSCAATTIAIAAFVLGVIVMCIVCKICSPCKKTCKKGAAAAKKDEERPFEKRKPHPAPTDGSVEIYVGNLSYEMTEEQMRKEFEAFGEVKEARMITNRFNGKSKGFGFVQMPSREEAEKAIAALNGKEILGRQMKCNEAKNLI